ncbi:MAG TPA: mannitol-1-phosphate 5-dehydrogenase, partial [Enterococcus aquimarinus]|nr:mannitol-1-phosphate 5-dehydrogenase [Enterococcus aquimarinus]
MVGIIFNYNDPQDEQSREMHELISKKDLNEVIEEVTGITDKTIIATIEQNIERYAKK